MRTDVRRLVLVGIAALAALTAQSPAPKKASPAAALRMPAIAAEVLSPRSRLESDLRFLADEIGGRSTGSDAYEQALAWGLAALKRAGVDGGGLEPYDAPARWEGGKAVGSVVSPYSFPLRVLSFAMAPSTGAR